MRKKTGPRLAFAPTTSENIIVDSGLLEGAGTYQGGPKPTRNNNILLKKKKEDMRNGKNRTIIDSETEEDITKDLVDFTTKIMWAFIYLLFFVSSVRVHQVTQKASALFSVVQLLMGHIVFVGLLNIDNLMNLNQCT